MFRIEGLASFRRYPISGFRVESLEALKETAAPNSWSFRAYRELQKKSSLLPVFRV